MKKFILLTFLTLMPVTAVASPVSWNLITPNQQSIIGRLCSDHVGVPYRSGNLTNEEWFMFKNCRENMADALVDTRPLVPSYVR